MGVLDSPPSQSGCCFNSGSGIHREADRLMAAESRKVLKKILLVEDEAIIAMA